MTYNLSGLGPHTFRRWTSSNNCWGLGLLHATHVFGAKVYVARKLRILRAPKEDAQEEVGEDSSEVEVVDSAEPPSSSRCVRVISET